MMRIFLIFLVNFLRSAHLRSTTRIIGGRTVRLGEYPMMAGIVFRNSETYLCGGTLISTRYVLTCAHCLLCAYYDTCSKRYKILVGDIHYRSTLNSTARQLLRISHVVVHHLYDDFTLVHDIAIIKLLDIAALSQYVQPAILGEKKVDIGTDCTTLGWGFSGKTDDQLRGTSVKIMENSICENLLVLFQSEKMICSGDFLGKNDSCYGDSGGPLLVNGTVVVGIVSFGYNCAQPGYGASYTNVSYYKRWIECQQIYLNLLPDSANNLRLGIGYFKLLLKILLTLIARNGFQLL